MKCLLCDNGWVSGPSRVGPSICSTCKGSGMRTRAASASSLILWPEPSAEPSAWQDALIIVAWAAIYLVVVYATAGWLS